MNIKETTSAAEIARLRLETPDPFDSVAEARAFLNDNYNCGDFVIFWDDFFGAYIYNAESPNAASA